MSGLRRVAESLTKVTKSQRFCVETPITRGISAIRASAMTGRSPRPCASSLPNLLMISRSTRSSTARCGCSATSLQSPAQRKPRGHLLECGAIIHPVVRAAYSAVRAAYSAAVMSTKRYIVRRESEADVKRYVNCIFKTVRHILGLGHSWTASPIRPFGGREVGEAVMSSANIPEGLLVLHRSMILEHLAPAHRHVAEGEEHLERQRRLVRNLKLMATMRQRQGDC
jgi:hypothetical protein